ncbi:MAG: pseudouridine synthase [Thermosynechococcaceae cyanobacterium]
MAERLQKLLAQWGIASRRQAEHLIVAGKVRVNGHVATLGQTANPNVDCIEVDGRPLVQNQRPELTYLLLHKPLGVVTTCEDPWGRQTVLDLLPPPYRTLGIHPVGRLDAQTTGALLLTNDGDLTFALTHPKHHIPKTYEVVVRGHPSVEAIAQWRAGVMLEGRKTHPAQVQVLDSDLIQRNATRLQVVLQEGRKRQIRLVAKILGHPVLQLHRTQMGPLTLQDASGQMLPSGCYRVLTPSEIQTFRHIINSEGCIEHWKESPYAPYRIQSRTSSEVS